MDHEERLKAALADRYLIEREIGSGGMATVYLAHDLKHDRQVAVKVLDPELAQSLGAERFLREIKTAANLTHPHILPLFDSGEADGFLFYTMPFVKGESLRTRLTQEKQLPVEDAIQITREIADALAYAHAEGVIHRDVKPANIMLEAGHAVLADFGVAHALAEAKDDRITSTGTSLGTPAYMSPEQATGEQDLDGRSDQYALGCMLYEMLAGEPPYTGPTAQAVFAKRMSEPVPQVSTLRETVPEGVEQALHKALAKAPVDRFSTAGMFAEALRPKPFPTRGTHPHRKRHPFMWRPATIALAVVILGVSLWWVSTRVSSPTGQIERIAVLPFGTITDGTDQMSWADGVHSAVIFELSRIGGLDVTPEWSVMRYRNSTMTLWEIAQDLGVDALLTGNVFRDGDSVVTRVSLNAGTPDEDLIWNETYDTSISDILSFYGGLAREITEKVGATLTPQEEARLAEAPEVNPDAYEFYVWGQHLVDQRAIQRFDEAIGFLEGAIEKDPSFAPAHAELARVFNLQATYFSVPTREAYRRGKAEALAAVGIDSTLAAAHNEIGSAKEYGEYDWEGAEEGFLRAIELDSTNAHFHQTYGQLLVHTGRTSEGFEQLRKAVSLDPVSPAPTNFLGYCLLLARRYDEGIRMQRKVVSLYPDQGTWHAFLATTLSGQGSLDEAISEFRKSIELGGRVPWILGLKAIAHGRREEPDSAEAILAELMDRSKQEEYVPADVIAWAHIGLGQDEQALDWLERAYDDREQGLVYLKMAPWFDPLRSHPRFQELLRKMDFPKD